MIESLPRAVRRCSVCRVRTKGVTGLCAAHYRAAQKAAIREHAAQKRYYKDCPVQGPDCRGQMSVQATSCRPCERHQKRPEPLAYVGAAHLPERTPTALSGLLWAHGLGPRHAMHVTGECSPIEQRAGDASTYGNSGPRTVVR